MAGRMEDPSEGAGQDSSWWAWPGGPGVAEGTHCTAGAVASSSSGLLPGTPGVASGR